MHEVRLKNESGTVTNRDQLHAGRKIAGCHDIFEFELFLISEVYCEDE